MFLELALAHAIAQGGPPAPGVRNPNGRLMVPPQPKEEQRPGRKISVATVTVLGEGAQEDLKAFVLWMSPALQSAAAAGFQDRESSQNLAEFMAQDPAKPRLLWVPAAFHYNALKPSPAIARK